MIVHCDQGVSIKWYYLTREIYSPCDVTMLQHNTVYVSSSLCWGDMHYSTANKNIRRTCTPHTIMFDTVYLLNIYWFDWGYRQSSRTFHLCDDGQLEEQGKTSQDLQSRFSQDMALFTFMYSKSTIGETSKTYQWWKSTVPKSTGYKIIRGTRYCTCLTCSIPTQVFTHPQYRPLTVRNGWHLSYNRQNTIMQIHAVTCKSPESHCWSKPHTYKIIF